MTLGVPDVDAVASYYEDFGLRRVGDRPGRGLVLATADGGEQLALRPAERRRLLEIGIGADDPDDLSRIEASLRRIAHTRAGKSSRRPWPSDPAVSFVWNSRPSPPSLPEITRSIVPPLP